MIDDIGVIGVSDQCEIDDDQSSVTTSASERERRLQPKEHEIDDAPGTDADYGDDCSYWLILLLTGHSIGRKLKRAMAKSAASHLTLGFALIIITFYVFQRFGHHSFFSNPQHWIAVMLLMWMVTYLVAFQIVLTLLCFKYWSSLMTNITITLYILRAYLCSIVMSNVILGWTVYALIATFLHVQWNSSVLIAAMQPSVICYIILAFPYVLLNIYYGVKLHFTLITAEFAYKDELNRDENLTSIAYDLEGFSEFHLGACCMCSPCLVIVQIMSLLRAVAVGSYIQLKFFYTLHAGRTYRGIVGILKAIRKFFASKPRAVAAIMIPEIAIDYDELARLARLAREAAAERERVRIREKVAARYIHREEFLLSLEEEYHSTEVATSHSEAVVHLSHLNDSSCLTLVHFRALWISLSPVGSFMQSLETSDKSKVESGGGVISLLHKLFEHLQGQGFHVVFTSTSKSDSVVEVEDRGEVGICNDTKPPWTLAHFSFSVKVLSVVIKSQDPQNVNLFVKKFALSRILPT